MYSVECRSDLSHFRWNYFRRDDQFEICFDYGAYAEHNPFHHIRTLWTANAFERYYKRGKRYHFHLKETKNWKSICMKTILLSISEIGFTIPVPLHVLGALSRFNTVTVSFGTMLSTCFTVGCLVVRMKTFKIWRPLIKIEHSFLFQSDGAAVILK